MFTLRKKILFLSIVFLTVATVLTLAAFRMHLGERNSLSETKNQSFRETDASVGARIEVSHAVGFAEMRFGARKEMDGFFSIRGASAYRVENNAVYARNGETVELSVYPKLLREPRRQQFVLTIPNYPPDKVFQFVNPTKYPTVFTWESDDYTPKTVKIQIVSDYDGEDESMILKLTNIEGDSTPILEDYSFVEIRTQGDVGADLCKGAIVATGGVPEGYGPPFDMLSGTRNPTLSVMCSPDEVRAIAGDKALQTFVYNIGFVSVSGEWKQITLGGTPAAGNLGWLQGVASANLPEPDSSGTNYVIAFVCQFDGSDWKCGCQDSMCTQNHWTMQMFKR